MKTLLAVGFTILSVTGGRLSGPAGDLKAGDSLKAGERVSLTAGTAVISYAGAGKILLTGPATFTPAAAGGRLEAGGLLAAFRKRVKGFSVSAGPVTAAVRGTTFFLERRKDAAYLCLCDGSLEVSGKGLKTRLETKGRHKAFLFTPAGEKTAQADAGREGHTDAEIEKLLKP